MVQSIVITVFLTIYTSPWLSCNNYYFLIPSSFSPIPSTPFPQSGNPQNVLCVYECFCLVCLFLLFLDSICKWNHMVFVFLWLISLSTIPLYPFMSSQMAIFHSFLWLSNIALYLCTYLVFIQIIYRWALILIPYLGK